MARGKRGIAEVFARARAGDRRLAPWMTRHHDELLHELGTGRVEWTTSLAVFATLGLTDEHGGGLTRDTASRTWRRVRETVAATRTAEARDRLAPGELARGVRLVQAVAASPVPPGLDVRPARLLHEPATAGPITPSAALLPAAAEEATERIDAVLRAMGAARVPLPCQPSLLPPAGAPTPARDQDPCT